MFIQLYVMLFISFMKLSLAVPSEIMIDTDDSADNPREVTNIIEKEELKLQKNNICHMEVQVTRHILGYCIKHGLASHSCVADGYLHPFHRECLTTSG